MLDELPQNTNGTRGNKPASSSHTPHTQNNKQQLGWFFTFLQDTPSKTKTLVSTTFEEYHFARPSILVDYCNHFHPLSPYSYCREAASVAMTYTRRSVLATIRQQVALAAAIAVSHGGGRDRSLFGTDNNNNGKTKQLFHIARARALQATGGDMCAPNRRR
jgi:hypothetical protein